MLTIAVNAAIVVWVVLLLCAPGLILIRRWKLSGLVFVVVATFTLVVISAVTFATALMGYSTIWPLRVCAIGLALLLVAAAVDLVRDWTGRGWRPARLSPTTLALPIGVVVGLWAMLPPLVVVHNQGERFGLVTLGNADIANYVLFAENAATAGFTDNHHVMNGDLGAIGQHYSYVGATALINFATAATGLPAIDVVIATMGVAVTLLLGSLWALSAAIWTHARLGSGAAAIISSLAGLSAYTLGHFFLASVLGLAGVSLALAGAIAVARGAGIVAHAQIATGGALAIYCYGHLGVPLLVVLPISAVAFRLLINYCQRAASPVRPRVSAMTLWSPDIVQTAVRAAAAALAAAGLSILGLPTAVTLVRSQSTVVAGFPLPPMSAFTAFGQPAAIGAHDGAALVLLSWAFVVLIGATALGLSWQTGQRVSAAIAGVCGLACFVVIVGAMVVYGPTRYQAWKMEAFLFPLATTAILPALSSVKLRLVSIGKLILFALLVLVMTNPARVWGDVITQPQPALVTSPVLINLSDAPALKNVASINVRLSTFLETMSAAGALPNSTVVFTQESYYPAAIAPGTCTLTERQLVDPSEDPAKVTDLGGGYVILARPSPCATRP